MTPGDNYTSSKESAINSDAVHSHKTLVTQ